MTERQIALPAAVAAEMATTLVKLAEHVKGGRGNAPLLFGKATKPSDILLDIAAALWPDTGETGSETEPRRRVEVVQR